MKIAVLGATGHIGSRIVNELATRGHAVTGFARNIAGKTAPKGANLVAGDVSDLAWLTAALKGFDAVVSALHFETLAGPALVSATKAAGVPRLLVVGGAASLYLPDGSRLIDSPNFPKEWQPIALPGIAFVDDLRANEKDLDWTFLSPSALIEPGTRTGKFRLGGTELLADAKGESRISTEDYAVAMADEVEHPAHSRRQFTAGY
jgi:putative NADH-flavin reductase